MWVEGESQPSSPSLGGQGQEHSGVTRKVHCERMKSGSPGSALQQTLDLYKANAAPKGSAG